MTREARLAATVVLAILLAATSIRVGSPHANASSVSAVAVGGCPTHAQVACVDRGDGGRTVHVRGGHILRVVLGGATLRWSGLHQVGPALLRRSGRIVSRDGGIMASYRAVKAGHTTLRAGGAPLCAPGRACPQFVLLWQVRVVVG